MNAIVSVTSDWGIGLKGGLLVRNRTDMRFFRQTTMGGTVICGRKTFLSFPGGALKGRRNIILTRNHAFSADNAEVIHSVEELQTSIADIDPSNVWLIGGASVYEALLPHCTRAYVTMNHTQLPADTWFPNLDTDDAWYLEETRPGGTTDDGIPFEFRIYLHT